jgi:hypothetical protein
MISVKTRIASVRAAAKMASPVLPEIRAYSAPAPAAPMVWAMVLRVRIAESGRSMSALSASMRTAHLWPFCLALLMAAGVSVSSAASSREQMNETPSARAM